MLIKSLSFKFDAHQKNYFFKDLTATFTPNTVHMIEGDNGVGKSTFFNILQGEVPPNAFVELSLELDGVSYSTHHNMMPPAFTQQVHMVRQQYDSMIASQFSFIENLQLANMGTYPRMAPLAHATLLDMAASLGIDIHTPAYRLSGGQRQLLAILMALQKPTKLLLLDEPTATLDVKNTQIIMRCLNQLAEQLKVTMLIICHDKELVRMYAHDRSFCMRQVEDGQRTLQKCTDG
ncbi:MAG: ATP-binding cassette domain-containing protein [Candidatus Babeliales bacterium]